MSIEERGKALEEAFFARKNKQLLAQLRQELDHQGQLTALQEATGIADQALLQRLLELDINAESIAAMSLAPMVLVAWADGDLDPKERDAIISGAEESGIRTDSTSGRILQGWLEEEPDESLKQIWIDYTHGVCSGLQPGDQAKLADEMMGRSKRVAEAAGGFLGLGSISKAEMDMLAELKAAFK